MRHGWKQMFCHTTKTKERCHTHHRQAVFNRAAKKYSRKSSILVRVWLMSQASPLVYNAIIFVWLELLACHTKWKCKRNVGHSTSTRGWLASTRAITCDLYHTSLWPVHLRPSLKPSDVKLWMYTQEAIPVLGSIPVTVTYKQQSKLIGNRRIWPKPTWQRLAG